ncbi:MAG: efflux RND transporter periplasmic adaptor subunit, partial [Acidobacteriota bacterium]
MPSNSYYEAPRVSSTSAGSVLAGALLAAGLFIGCGSPSSAPPAPAATPAEPSAVAALGRLEPGPGVVEVGAPPGDRLESLAVDRGDAVAVGQVLAVLESHGLRRAELDLAAAARAEAVEALRRARRSGPLAVSTREAEVRRLEADLELAASDLARTRSLVEQDVLPARELDVHRSRHAQARALLEQGRSQLAEQREAAELDVRGAEAALARAEAAAEAAEVSLERTTLRAPVTGDVLDIRLLPGEATTGGPILTLGEVGRMVAVAEVYETDIGRLRVGQAAEITSPALGEALRGTVETVGSIVRRNDVLSLDPAARTDVRVVETRIRLEDPETARRYVHLQVDVRIDTGSRLKTSLRRTIEPT